MAGTDKLIGTLHLDISQLDGEIQRANKLLKELGQGVNLDFSDAVMKAVEQKLQAITKAAENYGKKMAEAGRAAQKEIDPVTSAIANLSKSTTTFNRINGDVRTVAEGFDTIGRKITEVSNKMGQITSQKVTRVFDADTDAAKIKELVSLYNQLGQARSKTVSAYGSGKQNEGQLWEQQANEIEMSIERILRANERLRHNTDVDKARESAAEAVTLALRKQADAQERVAQAQRNADVRAAEKKAEAEKAQQIKELISLYNQYSQAQTKMMSAQSSGKQSEAEYWRQQSAEISAAIDRIIRANEKLFEETGVQKARADSINAVTLALERQADAEAKASAQASDATKTAQVKELVSLYNQLGQAWANAILAQNAGKTEEASQWSQRADAVRQQINAIYELNSALSQETQVMGANQAAADAVAMANAKVGDAATAEAQKLQEQNTVIKQATRDYEALRTAVQDYKNAQKYKNESGMQEAQRQIQALEIQIGGYQILASRMEKDSQQKKDLIALIERMKTSYQQYLSLAGGGAGTGTRTGDDKAVQKTEQAMNRILSLAMNLVLYRGLRKFWTEAKNFATEYYNTIKEIQVVTQNTDAQMATISANFKQMAADLNVSMTDIAKGAVIFFRQGLSEEETERRLAWATKFSRISGSSLEEASQYITAVLNSMQSLEGDAQRVVDVFTYMGDNAATSGAEIATAMGKAAATADNAGMEFEFLAAAIASVSATTRQAPENIGTAFNTMMARLHSIKQKGYNDEDETKINDVAKALNKVGISLMDTNGEWRDFDDILTDVAAKWDTLTDKQQAYIATTMAGVRAQNYFIALMNDMSKGLEGGSQMWSLYYGAKGSEGVVDEKYLTWLTSVEAAQNKLTLAVQRFYDALHMGDFFTGFFSGMGDFINFINRGIEATDGLTVTFPILFGLLAGLIASISLAIVKSGTLKLALIDAFKAHPIATFIIGLTAAVTLISIITSAVVDFAGFFGNLEDSYDKLADKSTQKLSEIKSSINDTKTAQKQFTDKAKDIEKLRDRYVELTTKVSLTAEEEEELNGVIQQLINICPGLRTQLDATTGKFNNQTEAVAALNSEIERNYELAQLRGQHDARNGLFRQIGEASAGINERRAALQGRTDMANDFANYFNNANDGMRGAWQYAVIESNGTKTEEEVAFEDWARDWIRRRYMGEKERNPLGGYTERDALKDFGSIYGLTVGSLSEQDKVIAKAYEGHQDLAYQNAQLESDTDQLIDQARSTLGFFENINGLSAEVLNYAELASESVYAEVETAIRNGTLTEDFLNAKTQDMNSIWTQAKDIQNTINTDTNIYNLRAKADAAKEKYLTLSSGEGTAEDIKNAAKEYNAAAKELNTALVNTAHATGEVYSLIDENEVDLSHASDVVAEQEENINDIVAQRRALREARESGFAEQRRDLWDALYDENGVIQRGNYITMADQIKAQNPYIWQAMMSDWKFEALDSSIRQGFSDGGTAMASNDIINETALEILAETSEYWNEATEAAEEYYDTINEEAGRIETDEDFARTFRAAYEEGGIGSVIDKYNALLDSNEDFTTAFLARHPEIAAMLGSSETGEGFTMEEFDAEAWLAEINALIPGTVENIGSLVDVLGETGATAEESIEAIDGLLLALDGDLSDVTTKWDELTEAQKKTLKKLGVDEATFKGLKKGSDELKNLKVSLQGLKTKNLESLNRVLSGTSNAVTALGKGTKDWIGYQKTLFTGIDTATKLQGAYEVVMDKSKEGTDEYTESMSYLSQQTGLTAEQLGTSGGMAQALLAVENQASVVQSSIEALAGSLLTMDGISFDPSQIVNGYISLGEGADEAAVQVMNLVNTALELLGATISFTPDGNGGGAFSVNGIKGQKQATKADTSGKGGGGGGGGGKKDSFSDRLAIITAQMGRSVDKYKELLERLSLYESMYNDQGELTNVLRVQEQRRKVLIDQQEAYEAILEDLPGLIQKAKEEMAKYEEDSEDYKKALQDLQNLEDSYASYTQELIKNRAEQLKNADAMKETREAIIQLESNLRNTIQSVIMDRENREKASLAARISMEGDVLEAIQRRYEKERDEIIETTDLRIESLNKETDALSDALDERKNLAEDADKMEELLTLQDQYARIVADPTRAKETKEIAQKIADLQEEIGWTVAEREVEARQKEIQEEIDGLEDYEKATEKFYDELLQDPRNFIEEYNRILSGTDAEIINWLTENSESYVKATDASREQLLQGWKDTLDELRMYTRTVWDEVEQIISLGDGGIMEFLLENSQEYREANAYGKLDLIYQWQEMLDDWHSAYVDSFEELDYMEFTNTLYDWVTYLIATSKSGGGGGGGTQAKDKFIDSLKGQMDEDDIDLLWDIFNLNLSSVGDKTSILGNRDLGSFASGGLAYGTGLAHLDGTAGLPERVLSPEQTAAFERLVDFITAPGRVSVPGLYGGMAPAFGNGASAYFGDINISVASLDSDTDVDNLADKLMDAINERMTRGMAVGGIAMGY